MMFRRLFEKKYNNRLNSVEEEVEQLQSDDNYVKNLALENRGLINENALVITQVLGIIETAQLNKEGLMTLVKLQSENIVTLKKKIEDIEKALTILLR